MNPLERKQQAFNSTNKEKLYKKIHFFIKILDKTRSSFFEDSPWMIWQGSHKELQYLIQKYTGEGINPKDLQLQLMALNGDYPEKFGIKVNGTYIDWILYRPTESETKRRNDF